MSRIEQALRRAQQTELESASDPEDAVSADAIFTVRAPVISAPEVERPRAVAPPAEIERPRAVAPPAEVERPRAVVPPAEVERPRAVAAPAEVDRPRAVPPPPVTQVAVTPVPEGTRERRTDEKLVVSSAVNPVVAEQYRKLAVVLHQLHDDRGGKVVMVASAIAGDGKTLTATNIALTLSESFRRRVLLVDADLRRPSVHKVLGLSNVSGLNDGLGNTEDQKLTIIDVSPRLSVLPAGRPNPDPMGSLTSKRMCEIMEQARARFDWVVLDTPPLDLVPDASLLAEMSDAVVLVVSAGRTPFRSIDRAVNLIDRKRIVGVVLNRVVNTRSSSYYDYYGADAN